MTITALDTGIDTPGVYTMTAEEYHADPVAGGSLSSSGARKILPPGCPARFRYDRDHPPEPKRHFDLGHGAHKLVLGVGPVLTCIEADSFRTKAAQAARDEAYEKGRVPLLTHEYEQVQAMAEAILTHPIAGKLFRSDLGIPEAVIVWRDEATGVWCRAMLDWLPHRRQGRAIIPDLKTAASAEPEAFARTMATYGYHLQAEWNRRGCQALGLVGPDAEFVDVVVEKDPPHLVTVVQPDHAAMRIGQVRNHEAMQIFADCQRTERWPAYSDDVEYLALPAWEERKWEDML